MGIALKVAILAIVVATPTSTAAQESMRILTYATGLVTGRLLVNVDLGAGGRPADLYLDREKACSLSAAAPSCTVDLGPDPHVHLLELVREAGDRVERWINRPGQEAELTLEPVRSGSRCGARIGWAHPEQQSPVELEVTLGGAEPQIADDGRRVFYPCPEPGETRILVAMAVFADGRRVEAAEVIGGLGDATSVNLQAVALAADVDTPCESGAPGWPAAAERLERSGFEVVIVLDPDVRYRLLYTSGWNTGQLTNTSGASTKVFDQLIRSGSKNSRPKPKSSWLKAKATVFDADRLWYVAPDQGLHRINGFGQGRPNWLDLLFRFGMANVPGKPRIADAVAASGLVAAAGPRRRAVVLVLGNKVEERDDSRFSPQQARDYLEEINVPLVVLRNGRPSDDGWPTGLPALDMEALAQGLQTVRQTLDAQCIAWLSPEWSPNRLAAVLPAGIRLAGRSEDAPVRPASAWERAEFETIDPLAEGLTVERLAITAITVVISATDGEGRPLTDLSTDDFDLLEDGRSVTVLDLSPVPSAEAVEATGSLPRTGTLAAVDEAKELPVAIYIDRTVGGGLDQRQALRAVTGEIDRLAALGPVEIVIADKEQVRTVIGPTRDPSALAQALHRLSARTIGQHPIERIRRHFVQQIRQIPGRNAAVQAENGDFSTTSGARTAFAARTSAGEENVIVSRFLERLRLWAQRETGQRAGLLIVVGAGFDEDPLDFYASWVEKQEPHNVGLLREDLKPLKKEARVNELGRELASTGWRILTVAGQTVGSPTFGADSRPDKLTPFRSSSRAAVHVSEPESLLLHPIAAQRNLAEPSGGDVVVGPAGLATALDAASGWYQLVYQVARPLDGAPHALTLDLKRPGIEVRTTRTVLASTSEGQAEARVRRLLGGASGKGELQVTLAVGSPIAANDRDPGAANLIAEIEATVHFGSFAGLMRPGNGLRVSVGIVAGGAEPRMEHRKEQIREASAGWIYTFPARWLPDSAARLAVTVEHLASGLWGGTVVDLALPD